MFHSNMLLLLFGLSISILISSASGYQWTNQDYLVSTEGKDEDSALGKLMILQDCLLQCQAQLKQKAVFRFVFIMLRKQHNSNLKPT